MRNAWMLAAIVAVGCAGDEVDMGNNCTGALYDKCFDEHQCDSVDCRVVGSAPIQFCTQACSASMPCPDDAEGNPVMCNAGGLCEPTAPRDCRLQ